MQDIEKRHGELIPKEKIVIPVEYRTLPTGSTCNKDELMQLLEPYIQRGLKVIIGDETWKFSCGKKNDSGNLRMPIKIALRKAAEVLT